LGVKAEGNAKQTVLRHVKLLSGPIEINYWESGQISFSSNNGVASTGDMALSLIENMCVIIVFAYLLTRTRYFTEVMDKKFTLKNQAVLILFFGGFSIFGSLSGINLLGAIANVRDLGPMIAGLVGGPFIGVAAGLIGATARFFMGGPTVIPCTLATVLAGLFGGIIYVLNKGKFVGVIKAGMFAFLMESLHMVMALFLTQPFSLAVIIVGGVSVPMILSNTLGMMIFIFIASNLLRERKTTAERNKYLLELERKKQELKIASDIQRSFLPESTPNIEGFEVSASNLSALEVGGDFYDFIPITSNKWGLLIADVSGNGIPAALFMALSRTLIHASTVGKPAVANSIRQANKLIFADAKSGAFVTLFYGVLDTEQMTFTYVNAGHNPPIMLKDASNEVVLLRTKGIALGAIEDIELQEAEIKLAQGDEVILYTDGVTEAIDQNNEQFSQERLIKVIKDNPTLSAQDLTENSKRSKFFCQKPAPI
jgi:sigma-B regulation protein RsbU (phosphoserine phosphatase)